MLVAASVMNHIPPCTQAEAPINAQDARRKFVAAMEGEEPYAPLEAVKRRSTSARGRASCHNPFARTRGYPSEASEIVATLSTNKICKDWGKGVRDVRGWLCKILHHHLELTERGRVLLSDEVFERLLRPRRTISTKMLGRCRRHFASSGMGSIHFG